MRIGRKEEEGDENGRSQFIDGMRIASNVNVSYCHKSEKE